MSYAANRYHTRLQRQGEARCIAASADWSTVERVLSALGGELRTVGLVHWWIAGNRGRVGPSGAWHVAPVIVISG